MVDPSRGTRPERLVVVGADAGGMTAASQARKLRGPADLEIIAVDSGRHASYSACGIPYWIGGVVSDVDTLVVRTAAEFRSRYDIDVRLRHKAVGLDLDRRVLTVRDLAAEQESTVDFDQLVIATGAVPVRPPLPGIDAPGVYGVQTLDDGEAVRAALDGGARRAVVVGGGYIGLELAEALVQRDLEVTVVEAAAQPMSTLDPDMGVLIAEALAGMGITVCTGEPVTSIETGPDGRAAAVITDRRRVPADLVVLGLGVRPNTALAASAGIALGVTGGIVTDRRMRVAGRDGVWAAGDCVQTVNRVSLAPAHVALGTHANKQGRVAGINIGGGYATFPGVVGTAVTKVCALEVARTGLLERDAERAGFRYVTAVVESTTRAGYFPGAAPITTKLIAEKRSGRLLGAQIVGREGAAKRIDTLATALWNEMTVEELAGLDLSYAPPFAPVWDPVLIAARKAWDAVEAEVAGSR
jgi:NADPH-dependent 2,4-dienoyl-CoA reductase/sulfur reductase-like enzyme